MMRVTSIIIVDRLNTCEKGGNIRGGCFYLFMLCLLMRPPPLLLGSSGVVVCTSWSRLTYVPTKYPQPTFSPPKKKFYPDLMSGQARIHSLFSQGSAQYFFPPSLFSAQSSAPSKGSAFTEIVRRREILLCSDLPLPQRASAPPEIVGFLLASCYQRPSLRVQSHRRIRAIGLTERTHIPSVSVIPKCVSKLQRFLDFQASAVTIPSRPSPAPSSKENARELLCRIK